MPIVKPCILCLLVWSKKIKLADHALMVVQFYTVSWIGMLWLTEVLLKYKKGYSITNIWEASNLLMIGVCTSVSIQDFLSSNSENFVLLFRIFTLYSKSLPLDLACRVWDVFCRDGEEFLFRTALGILKLFEDILTKMDFIHIAQFLTKLPEDLPSEEFFASIAAIQMQSRNKKWAQVKRMSILVTDCTLPMKMGFGNIWRKVLAELVFDFMGR